jgi:DNA-binding NarL/FixJ family response regulator
VQLVLLDWMMPGLDGAGTLGQLRAQDHPGRVVVITALCDPAVQAQALEAGATGTLLKTEALGALPQLLNPG